MTGGRSARLARSLARLQAVILAGFVLVELGLALSPGDTAGAARLGVATAFALVAGLLLVRGESAAYLVVALPLSVVTALPPFTGPTDVTGPLAFTACLLLAMRTLPLTVYLGVALGLTALVLLVREATDAPLAVGTALSYLLGIANASVAGAFVRSLTLSTRAVDAAEAETRSEQLRVVGRQAQERAVDDARQVLHDDVLAALRALADREHVTPEDVRVLCRRAVSSVDQMADVERLAGADPQLLAATGGTTGPADATTTAPLAVEQWLSRVLEASPIPVRATTEVASWALSPAQEDAAARAVLEALRNVRRHAGVTEAEVEVTGRRDGVDVVVRDRGDGMAPDAVEGVGVRESIRGALRAVGGTVDIRSGPEGTEVRCGLTVARPPRALRRTYGLTMSAGGTRQLIPAAMLPMTATWAFVGAVSTWRSDGGPASWLLLAAAAVIALLITDRLRRGAPTAAWLAAVLTTLLGLQTVGLALMPPGALLDLRSWSVGFLATTLLVLCFVMPVRLAVGVIVAHVTLLLVAWRVAPGLSDGALPVTAINAVTGIPVLTLLLGWVLRRNAAVVESAQARTFAATSELQHRRHLSEVFSLHLDHTRDVIVPWLRAVADGRLDPGDPGVTAHARLLVHEARDDLHAPGFHDPGLRTAVTAYRAGGGVVDIRPGFEPGAQTRRVGQALRLLATHLPPSHRISVTPPVDDQSAARLVVAPAPPPEGLPEALARSTGKTQHRDAVTLVLEIQET